MTETAILFAVVTVTAGVVSIALWFPLCHVLATLATQLVSMTGTMQRERDKERHDAMHFVQQVIEKITVDPRWLAAQHARERDFQRQYDTGLEREEIRQGKPSDRAPSSVGGEYSADGVPAADAAEAAT